MRADGKSQLKEGVRVLPPPGLPWAGLGHTEQGPGNPGGGCAR